MILIKMFKNKLKYEMNHKIRMRLSLGKEMTKTNCKYHFSFFYSNADLNQCLVAYFLYSSSLSLMRKDFSFSCIRTSTETCERLTANLNYIRRIDN